MYNHDEQNIVDTDWPAAPYVGNWYVAVLDGGKRGFILGPYDRAQEATDNISLGRRLAEEVDPWSSFYTFAICNLPTHVTKPGILMHMVEQENKL